MATTILIALSLASAAAPPPPVPGYDVGADPWRIKALLYLRADSFRAMAAARMCDGSALRSRFDAASERLERARATLAELSKSPLFRPARMEEPRAPQCDDERAEITMRGFEYKILEIEAAAKAGVP